MADSIISVTFFRLIMSEKNMKLLIFELFMHEDVYLICGNSAMPHSRVTLYKLTEQSIL